MFKPLVIAFTLMSLTVAVHADHYEVDPVHSGASFMIKHLDVSNVQGRFDTFSGSYVLDDDAGKCSFNLTIEAGSVNTNHEGRDKHLTGPDFFNAKQFPSITFKSTKVEAAGDMWNVTGDLTMLGQTHPVTVQMKKIGEGDTGRAGYRSGVEAVGKIKRSQWGMTYGIDNGALGDTVMFHINLEGVRK